MTIYYIVLFFILALAYTGRPRFRNKRIIYVILWLMILFCGLRDPFNYKDMPNYAHFFEYGVYDEQMGSYDGSIDFVYSFFNKAVKFFTTDFNIYSFLVTVIIVCGYYKFIKKFSPFPLLAIALFAVLVYLYQFFLIRQLLAVIIGLLSFKYVLEKKIWKCMLCCTAAAFTHTTAIMLFPVYFVFHYLGDSKKTRYLLFGGSIFVILSFNFLANWIFANYSYYQHYLEAESESTLSRTIMKIYIFFLYCYTLKKDIYIKDIRYLVLICLIMNIVIYAGCQGIYGAYRLRYYFEISEIIGIPIIMFYCRHKKTFKYFAIKLGTLFYFMLLCLSAHNFLQSENMNMGYKSLITLFD